MDKPMPLDVARSQLEQSLADYARAYDASSTADHAVDRLNASGRIRGTQSEWEAIRRYVLGLGSAVARRYST